MTDTKPTNYEFTNFINPAFPDRPRRLPRLTIDEMVCAFLALHDVAATPVDADIRMTQGEAVMMGAAFGLVNPAAWGTLATGGQMRQDARIAARQEWTSWKQWALAHRDWPTFKEETTEKYDDALEAADAWENDPANQFVFARLIQEGLAAQKKSTRASMELLAVLSLVVGGVIGLTSLLTVLKPQAAPATSSLPQQIAALA